MIFETAWRNGSIVSLDRLPLDMPWEPWGERGKGAFTTTRSRLDQRCIAFWPRHRRRLTETLDRIGLSGASIPLPTEGQLVEWVGTLGAGDVCLRINAMESASGEMEVWAVARPLPITPVPTRLAFSSEPVTPDRSLKLIAQLWRRRATAAAAAKGVWDVIASLPGGRVLDASRSNIVLRLGDSWAVAWAILDDGGMLPGVVASSLVESSAAGAGAVRVDQFDAATEVVATNSVRGVVPIHEVEGREFKPGSATEELRRWVEAEAVAHAQRES